jgi:transcriptional regulator with XRE-family HTH domain
MSRPSRPGGSPANLAANQALGRHLIDRRQAHQWSQREFAKRLDKPPATISAWETGKSAPEVHNLIRIADVLATSVADLLAGAGIIKPLAPSVEPAAGSAPPDVTPALGPLPIYAMDALRLTADGHPTGERLGVEPRSTENADPNSYAVLVNGSGVFPRAWPGDCLEIQTDRPVESGDTALIVHRSGNRWVTTVTLRGTHRVELTALAPYETALEFARGDVTLHRVTGIRLKSGTRS